MFSDDRFHLTPDGSSGIAGFTERRPSSARRESRASGKVRTAFDEETDSRGMTLVCRPHHGCRSAFGILSIQVCAAVDQDPHGLNRTGPGSQHQWRPAEGQSLVGVGAGVEQGADGGGIPVR